MTINELSQSALFAKVKACSTSLLSEQDCIKAASCSSLADFASYLKNKTPYAIAFEGIGSSVKMTRQHLESVIKRMTFIRIEKIIRYASISDNFIADYFLMKHETECIISRLRQHGTYSIDSYLMYMPEGFFTGTCFDLKALEHATDIKSILDVLRKTHYGDLLAPILENHKSGRLIPENLLYRNLYESGAQGFKKKLNSEHYKGVEEFLSMLSDMLTVSNIYRIKKYYPENEEAMLLNVFSSSLTRFTSLQLSGLKHSASAKEFTKMLATTKYKELSALFESQTGAIFTKQYIYNACKKSFTRTNNAALCALCYSILVNTEADNLITIAEGISSQADTEHIISMLIK